MSPFQRSCLVASSLIPATSRSATTASRGPPASPPLTSTPQTTMVATITFASRAGAVPQRATGYPAAWDGHGACAMMAALRQGQTVSGDEIIHLDKSIFIRLDFV